MNRLLTFTASLLLLIAVAMPAYGGTDYAYARVTSEAEKGQVTERINDVYVIHFILDGTNREAFNTALKEGWMPTVEEKLVKEGAVFTEATSVFPSTSSSAYQAIVSGLLPGHAGIPHLERFARESEKIVGYLSVSGYKMLNTDLINLRALTDPDVAEIEPPTTIFELLSGYPTAAVYSSFCRGAAEIYPEIAPVGALWSTFVSEKINNLDFFAMKRLFSLYSRPREEIPRYTLVGLYSSDVMGHKHGPTSHEVKEMLRQFDLFLREYVAVLKKSGIEDKTYIIVSADHGMHETGQLFQFQQALEEKGVATKPRNPRDRNYTLYAANRGVSSSHIYVRHNGSFEPLTDPNVLRNFPLKEGGTADLIEMIRVMDATGLIMIRAGERKVHIIDHEGESADVASYDVDGVEYYSYTRSGGDPLGYSSAPGLARLADGRPHSTYAWRQLSATADYPDAVIALSEIFHDGRAGDIFVTTRERYGFRKVKSGNHGGATSADMRVPLLMRGPTVEHGEYKLARLVDLYPLVLSWFGIPRSAADHDGMNPFTSYKGDDPLMLKLALLDQLFDGKPALSRMVDAAGFVRKDILPQVPERDFASLKQLASSEKERRGRLVKGLHGLLERMLAQKDGKGEKVVKDERYLDDHIAIVKRALALAEERAIRMGDIQKALAGCWRRGNECQGPI